MEPGLVWMSLGTVILAGWVHGTFGIGFPLIATPLLALVTDVRSAVFITLLPTMAVNLAVLAQAGPLRSAIGPHWRVLPYVMLGTIGGSLLLVYTDPKPFLLILAAAMLLYLNQDRLKRLNFAWIRRRTGVAYAVFGVLAGVMAGTVNVMVPILIILSLELQLAVQAAIKLFNLNFLTGKLTQTGVLLGGGHLDSEVLLYGLWLIPAALLGLAGGFRARKYISETNYRKVLRGLLWAMCGLLVARYFSA